jgi:hypothetical protein
MIYGQKDRVTQIVIIPKLIVIQNELKNPIKTEKDKKKKRCYVKI